VDNVENSFPSTQWENLRGSLLDRIGMCNGWGISDVDDDFVHYALLDLCPYGINDLLVPLANSSSAKLRIEAGDTNPLRVMPLEICLISEM